MARGSFKKYKKKLNQLTFGLFDTLIDVFLFCIFFQFTFTGTFKTNKNKDIDDAINDAIDLTKITNVNSFKRIIYRAKARNYFQKKQDYFQISQLGEARLRKSLPTYEIKRPWDGILYLVTYDIPEEKKIQREYLRQFLKRLGCAMLQKSVWLTPYNPKKLIIDFIKQKKLYGLVLVSELKEGSNIGGKDMKDVLEKIYNLKRLNQKYQEFVNQAKENKIRGLKLILQYLSILKKDPQLPFELMDDNYWDEEAYELYKQEIKRLKHRG